MTRPRGGGIRTVVYLSEENAISVFAAITPSGSSRPPFGATSEFFNQLVENWRISRARKDNADGQPAQHPTIE